MNQIAQNNPTISERRSSFYVNSKEIMELTMIQPSLEPSQPKRKIYLTAENTPKKKNPSKRIAVIGSRGYKSLELIEHWMNHAKEKWQNITVVSGGAVGVDKQAESWAIKNQIDRDIYIPSWNTQGKKAGILRNKKIVENADFVLAFWDEESPGTESSLNYAKKIGKPCIIVFEDGYHKNW